MLGWGQISDAPISDSAPGGTLFTQNCQAQTTPPGSLVRQIGKLLRATSGQLINYVRNNSMVGAVAGTPGTLPNNWVLTNNQGGTGISSQIVGTGVESSLPYIDFRFFGTPTLSNDGPIPFADNAIAGAAGQTWTGSWYIKLIAGTFPGAIDIFTQGQGGGGDNSATAGISADGTLKRFSQSRSLTDPGTTTVRCGLLFHTPQSVAFDFTVRLYAPQVEPGSVANAVILTTSGAVSVGTATLVRLIGKVLTVTTTPVAALARRLSRAIQASVTPVPTRTSQTGKPLRAATTPPASLVRQTGKLLRATVTPAATMVRTIAKLLLQASTTPVASLYRNLARSLQATVTPSARLYLRLVEILRGAFPRSVTLGGDSVASRTTLGGGSDRTTLGGDER